MLKLLCPEEMSRVEGLDTPSELYVPYNEPVLLAGMRYLPADISWDNVSEAGHTSIVCLTAGKPGYDP